MTISGKCLCGSIEVLQTRRQIKSLPVTARVANVQPGAASYNFIKSDESAKVVTGKTKAFHEKADSGNSLQRHFCGDCGSPIYSVTTSYPGVKIWKAGLFADYDGMEIVTNIWCDSAPTWASIDKSIPSHAKARQ